VSIHFSGKPLTLSSTVKVCLTNLKRTTRFWNNLHQVWCRNVLPV